MSSPFSSTNLKPSTTLSDILCWRAVHEPLREAYTFLLDGATRQVQMTYADLDCEARRVAALLQDCTAIGERVLLLYPPGLEYVAAVFGCFYAGVVAVPAYPPRLNQSLTRIETILRDARATVALTTAKQVTSLQRTFADYPLLQDVHWIETDSVAQSGGDKIRRVSSREVQTDPKALALLQYTSGSTGSPKGVMLTHTNLVQNAALIQEGMSLTSETRGVFWLPPYHDMGLGGILQALYTGYPILLMAPATFLQRPFRWLQAISSFHATLSGGPNFAYDLCVKKATPDTIGTLDLSSWTVAVNGAEPVRAETLRRFAETFAPCGFRPEMFYPCYGMAEATLFVSGGQRLDLPRIGAFDIQALETGQAVETTGDQESSRLFVGCGYVRQGQEVAIVDPQTHILLSPGTIGEIWVRGPNVAQGYWDKPEETSETFQAFIRRDVVAEGRDVGTDRGVGTAAGPCPPLRADEGPFLRTGDLGFCLEEELFVTGRLKDLIIIRGRNLYPQDIEEVVEKSHQLLRQSCCAAFAVEGEGGEQLVVVQEVVRHADERGIQEAIEAIRQAVLSAFDVEVSAIDLLRAGTIPKTTSGKIQRHACRSRFLAAELNTIHSFRRPPSSHANNADPSVGIEDVDEKGGSRPVAQGTGAAQDTGQGLAPAFRGRFLVGTGVSSPPTRVLPRKTPVRARPSRPSAHGDDLSPKIPTPERLAPTLSAPTAPPLGDANDRGPTRQEIVDWLVRQISESTLIDVQLIDIHAPFVKFNLNSLEVVSLSGDLEEWLRRSLSPTLLYDYPSIDALARYLASEDPAVVTNSESVGEIVDQQHAIPAGAIAVVGLGCRFPGANNPAAFWQMLYEGIDGISEIPATRWDVTQFYAPDQATPGKMNTRWGGFLQDIEQFDPSFFALSPREAEVMDPQQRLLLEVAWETFEQASMVPEKLAGSQTGVFIGISSSDYYALHHTNLDYHQAYTNPGSAHSIAANRLSYFFDFHGPSIAVDTSCSSSLVAVHQACQSLHNGECDLALAGGVNVLLKPEMSIAFSQARTMSSDGHCKTFDESANGYVRSEGCGLVLLKSLEAAERDGDPILAVIRGSAVNQDGRSNGMAAPNGPAQEAVIRHALYNAGVSPSDISYVETHGSSTPLGDPIEVGALKAVLMQERSPDQPCLLGAVKTNIGHLEAAAGIAGLIKTVLCLQKGVIAPNLHFKRLNPHISFAGTTFAIPTEPSPWPGSPHAPRFAGVSAFGFGGTNVHVVLERPPVESNRRDNALRLSEPPPIETPNRRDNALRLSARPVHLLTLSARTPQALSVLAQHYADFLATHPTDRHKALSLREADGREDGQGQATVPTFLRDLCYTAQTGRTHFTHRLAILAANTEQLREHLAAFVADQPREEIQIGQREVGQRRIAFLFPGQGGQYVNMARRLYETQPAFRAALDECDRLLRPLLPQNQHRRDSALRLPGESNLLSVLYPEPGATSLISEIAYTQPALFSFEYALAQMWLSWGIKPDVVMGHSMGEYVAACVAGLFSLEDGLKLIAARGRLLQALPEQGAVAVIFAEPEYVQALIEPYKQDIAIGAFNGPQNTMISGREETVHLIMQRLEAENATRGMTPIESVILTISQASHCPLVDPMLAALEQAAREVTFLPLRIPLVCNLTGQLLDAGETLDAGYWRRHTREPVQFAAGIQTLAAYGCDLFLELGPTPVLSKMGKHCIPTHKATWLTSLHQDHDDWHILMQSLAHLYTRGCNLNWSGLYGEIPHQRRREHLIALPTYPFEREYCWFKSKVRDQRDRGTINAVQLEATEEGETCGNGSKPCPKALEGEGFGQGQALSLRDSGAVSTRDSGTGSQIDFGLIFFSSREGETGREQAPVYKLVTASARYADQHGFSSIWIPERHFTKEGWLYPNPALLISALAQQTSRIHLRAGSVVAPLHHPLRIAEDWAVADHLSGGRVGVSFASGWHPNDFAFAPDHYADRSEVMYRTIEIVHKLWRGETVPFKGGDGKLVELKTYPLPLQREIPIWLTAAGNPQTFAHAGKLGANLLTHLYNQNIEELAEKIRIYRDARAQHGHDPATGQVSVMLHTYVGADMDTVRAQIQGPFNHYLRSASYLIHAIGYSRGQQIDLSRLSEQDLQDYLLFVTERLISQQRVLFGTPQTCAPIVEQLQAAGVNEIACQLDFGIANDLVLQNLPYLNQLREQSNGTVGTGASPIGDRKGGLGLTQSDDGVNPSSTLRIADAPEYSRYRGADEGLAPSRPLRSPDAHHVLRHTDAPEYSKYRGVDEGLAPSRPLRSPVPTQTQNEINTWLYQLRWQALDLPSLPTSTSPGHWLIFMDQKGIGQHLARQLQEQGHSYSLIEAGQTFQTIGQHHYRVNPANPQEIKHIVRTALAAVHQQPNQTAGTVLAAARQQPNQTVGTALAAVRALPLRGVIHLWSLDATPIAATNSTRLLADQTLGIQSALSLMQALIGESLQTRLWLITQGAQPVKGGEATLAVAQAPIWGLGKTCAMEHPEIWGGLIDLDPRATDLTISQLMTILVGETLHEHQIALRGTKSYVARMVHVEAGLLPESHALHISQDASYLITGGLWGLGLEVARWLARRGARHLILLSRSKLPPRETWDQVPLTSRQGIQIAAIRTIEQLGAKVHAASVDVTDEAQLAAFLRPLLRRDRLSKERPPIRGIIHAASVWQDAQGQSLMRPIVDLKAEDLLAVLQPKMSGGWLLSNLLQETPLDFFVSFSSAASLLGSVGQANYTAANEFLDILAYYQRAHGQPALSIDWGTIAEIGMGATPAMLRVHEYWESHGIERLSPQQVLQALELLIQGDLTRVGVLRLDWQLLQQFSPQMLNLPLVSQYVNVQYPLTDRRNEENSTLLHKLPDPGDANRTMPNTSSGFALRGIGAADREETHNESENGYTHVGVGLQQGPEQAQGTGQGQALSLRTALRDAHVQERHAILTLYIKEQIAKILRLPVHRLDTEQPLTTLGFDSLMAIELRNRIDLDLQTRIPIVSLAQGPSITQVVNHLLTLTVGTGLAPVRLAPVRPAPAHFPLSHNQKALWFLSRLAPESAAYNVPFAARIQHHLDVVALQQALRVLAMRHPILTSLFTLQGEEPVQQTQPQQIIPLEEIEAKAATLADLKQRFLDESRRPIDLTLGPVLRLKLYRRADDDFILGFIVHHIAVDFRALELLIDELSQLYSLEKSGLLQPSGLPERGWQNADYVRWQNALLQSQEGEQHWQYWQNELAGQLPVLHLPTDRPRPSVQTYKGALHSFSFSPHLVTQLRALASAEKVTLFTLMLTAYQVLLHRYTHQDDILVGTPALGRTRTELEHVIGYLANHVIVRARLGSNPTFKELLHQTKRGLQAALEHQDFPFPLLAQRLQQQRDPSIPPIHQTAFTWDRPRKPNDQNLIQNTRQASAGTGPAHTLSLEPFTYEQQDSPFDLSLMAFEIAGQLAADFRYNVDLFDASSISRMAEHFQTLLTSIVNDPDQYVREIPFLSEYELHTLVHAWNATNGHATDAHFAQDLCLHQLVERQVEQTPEAIAAVFEEQHLTFQYLNSQANQLAYRLREIGVGPDVLVGIYMDRALELVGTLLAMLKAGGAHVPLDPNSPQERLAYLLEDAQLSVVLTQPHLHHRLSPSQVKLILVDAGVPTGADPSISRPEYRDNLPCWIQPDNLAYLIYTSGSTGQPKGAMNTHRGICNHLQWMQQTYQLTSRDRVIQKTPLSFDVSVWEFFLPLTTGARVIVASPGGHQDPAYLEALIAEQQVTILHFVPSMLQAFLAVQNLQNCESLRHVMCGGETLTVPLQTRFFAQCPPVGTRTGASPVPTTPVQLHHLYGPSEAAIDVTWRPCQREIGVGSQSASQVPIGRPIANTQLYLLDENLSPVPIGVTGELYIDGAGLARGYYRRPALTAERFIPNPFVTSVGTGLAPVRAGTRLYRTGDLARYLPTGELEFVGRLDHQVKLRGVRIEPGEIETQLQAHADVQEAIVILRDDGELRRYLVAYVTALAGAALTSEQLEHYLRQHLPEYMIPASIVLLERLPLLPNGKVDRQALIQEPGTLPVASGHNKPTFVAPRSSVEHTLVSIWQQVLGLEHVGIHDNFFALGGDSILSLLTIGRAREEGLQLTPQQFLQHQTIAQLAHVASSAQPEDEVREPAIQHGFFEQDSPQPEHLADSLPQASPDAVEESYPLTPLQQGLLFHALSAPASDIYVEQIRCILRGEVDVVAFEHAWQQAITAHDILRTAFVWQEANQPLQQVSPHARLPFSLLDWRSRSPQQQQADLDAFLLADRRRGFDLGQAPLMRLTLIRLDQARIQMVWTHHHLLLDGWSLSLLFTEILACYQAEAQGERFIQPARRPYRDYIHWLAQQTDAQAETYWRQHLSGISAPTPLGVDRRLAIKGSADGNWPEPEPDTLYAEELIQVEATTAARWQAFANAEHVTLSTLVQAAWALLLSRYSGQSEILFGIVVAGRPAELIGVEKMIGLFINTVPVRVHVPPQDAAGPWLKHLHKQQIEQQPYQSSSLVQIQHWSDIPAHTPLFESLLVFENYPVEEALFEQESLLDVESLHVVEQNNYALTITVIPRTSKGRLQSLRLRATYGRQRFESAAIQRLLWHLHTILDQLVAHPQHPLASIDLLTQTERMQLLVQWNATHSDYPQDLCLHQLFEQQAELTPDAIAAVFEEHHLTYHELERRANQLAHALQRKGVGPERFVGVLMQQSLFLLIAVLATHKAGGIYVPLDPTSSPSRLRWILSEIEPVLLLSQAQVPAPEPFPNIPLLYLDTDWPRLAHEPVSRPICPITPEHLAYVMFTSGSTGQPKGVMIAHRSIRNNLQWMQQVNTLSPTESMLLKTPPTFDASFWELFWPLLVGGRIVIAGPQRDSASVCALIIQEQVTTVFFTPSFLQAFLNEPAFERCQSLRVVLCGGETLSFEVQHRFLTEHTAILWNLYGPTEATIQMTAWRCTREQSSSPVPIGSPIANTQIYLLDTAGHPVPVGVPGEVYIAGTCLARGYLHRPDLTAERFVPNPLVGTGHTTSVGTGLAPVRAGERLYRTGDLARYRADGAIEYLGRMDRQIKLRGVRIELDEIETVLSAHPSVQECAVVLHEEDDGKKYLVAYVAKVPLALESHALASEPPPEAELIPILQRHLREQLPDAVVPKSMLFLQSLPLTVSGKIDRKALPAPPSSEDHETTFVAPRNPVEQTLSDIWQDVLRVQTPVGIHDNFFALGGDSILSLLIIGRARQAGLQLTPQQFFQHQTIAQLAHSVQPEDEVREPTIQHGFFEQDGPLLEHLADSLPQASPDAVEESYPLTPLQQGLLFHALSAPASDIYVEQLRCILHGEVDVVAFEHAWQQAITAHAVLRTAFVWQEVDQPLQQVSPHARLPLSLLDWRSREPSQQQADLDAFLLADRRQGFDLGQAPLMRLTLIRLDQARIQMVWTLHHLLLDGWSLSLLLTEILARYQAQTQGKRFIQPARRPYRDYIHWLAQQTDAQAEIYWRQHLSGISAPTPLGVDRRLATKGSADGNWPEPEPDTLYADEQIQVEATTAARWQAFASAEHVTLSTLVQAAWALLLSRYSGQSEVLFGLVVAGRPAELVGVEKMIGLFINTVPVRVHVPPQDTAGPWLKHLHKQQIEQQPYQSSSLVQIQHCSDIPAHTPLFESLLVFENYPVEEALFEQEDLLDVESLYMEQRTNYALTITAIPRTSKGRLQSLHLRATYDRQRFEPAAIQRLLWHLHTILDQLVAHPQHPLASIDLLTQTERTQLLVQWNATHADYPQDLCLHQLFEQQAELTPDATAVVFEEHHLTYHELERRANQLAHALQRQGAGPERFVGVLMQQSLFLLIAVLATHKAGGIYVPLDPTSSPSRLRWILSEIEPVLLLSQAQVPAPEPFPNIPLLYLDTDWQILAHEPVSRPICPITPEHLAYVMFTSGSTGQPKGVMIAHRSIRNNLQWMQQVNTLSPTESMLLKTPPTFDASFWELFWPLLVGGRIVIAGPQRDSASVCALIIQEQVTTVFFTPSFLQAFLNEPAFERCQSLRVVLCGGETLPFEVQHRFLTEHTAILWNLYGPTEATIQMTAWCCTREQSSNPVPIGRPIANTQIYLLDTAGHPVPVGVPGEVYIAGTCLARGYLHRPDLTAERFVPNPLVGTGLAPVRAGERLYRTGDLARYRADGAIEYLGRMDRQIKLRGVRIELDEIETVLSTHPSVQECAVVLHEEDGGKKYLVAYVAKVPPTLEPHALASEPPAEAELISVLQRHLREQLPDAVVPKSMLFLQSLPLTVSGKIDRKALPAPPSSEDHEATFVAPRNPVEQTLSDIWQDVLRSQTPVGIHDNFFALGGDSILSLLIIGRARQASLQLTPQLFFQHQTIAQLARVVAPVQPEDDEDKVRGLVPLTPIQRHFFEQNFPQPQHFNQAVILQVPATWQREHLQQIVNAWLSQHDALRLRYEQTMASWQQRLISVTETETVAVEHIDLTLRDASEQTHAIEEIAKRVQGSLDPQNGPLIRVVLFELGTGQNSRLLIVIHHLAIDGVSWRILLSDLQAGMTLPPTGSQATSPRIAQAPTTSYQRWALHMQRLAHKEALVQQDRAYWLTAALVPTVPLPLDFPDGENTATWARQIHTTLSTEETRLLLQAAPQSYRSYTLELLLVAFLQTLAGWTGSQQIRLDLEGHGRSDLLDETLDVSHTVGWFTSLYPVLFTCPGQGEATTARWIEMIKAQLRSVPHYGITYGLLRYLSADPELQDQLASASPAQVSFNYLGQFDQVGLASSPDGEALQPAPESCGETVGPENQRSHLLDVSGMVIGGQLHLQWTYSEKLHRHTTIERLASEVMQALRELLAPCLASSAADLTSPDSSKEVRSLSASPCIPLQHAGEKSPFFCVHPTPGEIYCFLDLVKHLRHDRPFYGIQAPGLSADQELFNSIEEMAATYIDALLALQPEGPYLLGGYSSGGLVAFEMARQLQAQGCSVALLAILDMYPIEQNPSAPMRTHPLEPSSLPQQKDYTQPILGLVETLGRYWRKEIAVSYDDLHRLQADEQLAYCLDRLKEAQVVPDNIDTSQLRRNIQVGEANRYCLERYQPRPYAGRITLFCSEEAEPQPSLWTPFSAEPVEVHTVSGDHYLMVVEPYVKSLAQQLQQCLDQAEGRDLPS